MPTRAPTTTEHAIAGFMEDATAAFERAAAACGLIETRREIASERVRVRLAGPALAGYALPALAHHRTPADSEPDDLTITVFDTRSTGVAMPPPVWPTTAYTPTSEICGVEGGRFIVAFNVGTGVLDLLDTCSGCALHWIHDAALHPAYDVSSPFRLLLHWWLRRRGIQFMHAGAVAREDKGLLLVGRGGSGKSTAALACLLAGFDFLGDDYVGARPSPRPEAFNLYGSAKLEVGHLDARFGRLAGAVFGRTGVPDNDKAILLLPERFGPSVCPRAELVAMVIPRITRTHGSSLRPATTPAALRALVPSTCRQLTAMRKRDFDAMAELGRTLPAYTLEMGEEIDLVPELLAGLFDRSAT